MLNSQVLSNTEGNAQPQAGLSILALGIRSVLPFKSQMSHVDFQRLEKTMRDYIAGGAALFWQRQGMYVGAGLLAAFYYNLWIAVISFVFSETTEYLDNVVSSRFRRLKGNNAHQIIRFHNLLLLTSILSSISVGVFVILLVEFEGPSAHLTPLFFLFAAGLFAAVNNHQIPNILLVRLIIYGAVFLYIPIRDLWIIRPSIDSVYWLHFATVLFVLYFVVSCALIYMRLYQNGLTKLDQLQSERDRAEAAYELKTQFVATVSHELRTPLTSIKGAIELINSGVFGQLEDRAKKMMDIAQRNCDSLTLLIDDLLDIQKIESGNMKYTFQPTNLGQVISETIEAMERFTVKGGVDIQITDLDEHLCAELDKDRIAQALRNVLSNAIKFSKTGSQVEVCLKAENDHAQIIVRDYGVGIPENSKDIVFGKFRQIDSSDHRSFAGTGLGMNITEQIMRAHSGSIDYVSKVGQGTTFTLELPLQILSEKNLHEPNGSVQNCN